MSCLRLKTKLSVPDNKPWKGLISTLQKKLNRLLKPKPSNTFTRTQCYHHHHHDDQDDLEDDNKYDQGDAKGESCCVELNGVDARAEEFIDKMKRVWKLERQISDEN